MLKTSLKDLRFEGVSSRGLAVSAAAKLDEHDRLLLAELQANARISITELGRRVKLSQPAVRERVRKLETAGVIEGYRATVNHRALGYGIRAVVRLGRCDYGRVSRLIAKTPEVINAFNVTGENSWILEIIVVDVAHLDAVVSQFCTLAETSTSIVLKAPREHHPAPPA
jgi:Lrp/AsnC family leucine-responsive transcriptional regulator